MIKINSKLTEEEIKQKQSYEKLLDEKTYLLTRFQYDEINRLASLYDSLDLLLESFDSEDNVCHIIALLNHLNSSFFEQLENISSQSDLI